MSNLFLTLILVFLVSISSAQIRRYENLVFEGAGIRGMAYAGVLKELELSGDLKKIERVAGTSAGAITAMMVALGYHSEEIYNIISATKFQKFNDGKYFFLGGIVRLTQMFGWYRGDKFMRWLQKIIADKAGNSFLTFEELASGGFKELYITATCLNKLELLVLSRDTYPKMQIKDAVRASMAVPLYFEPIFIDEAGKPYKKNKAKEGLDILVDGGILANFPIDMFDSVTVNSLGEKERTLNMRTLGVRIDTEEQINYDTLGKGLAPLPINNLKTYLFAFYNIVLENLNREHLVSKDWQRTVSVSSEGITPKVKKLSIEQKTILIKSGEQSTHRFLNAGRIE